MSFVFDLIFDLKNCKKLGTGNYNIAVKTDKIIIYIYRKVMWEALYT